MEFNIVIGQPAEDGKVIVAERDGAILCECDNIEQARVYARGVQDGWRAASSKLGGAYVRYA